MKKIAKLLTKHDKHDTTTRILPRTVLAVVVGTEAFHAVNSIKLNLIMPTLANILHEDTVRSWQYGWHSVCIRYGNVLWDLLSVLIYITLVYVLWRYIIKPVLVARNII